MSAWHRLYGRVCSLVRRVWLFATNPSRPIEADVLPLLPRGRGVRKMLARAIRAERREVRGARIVRRHRDPVVDRRERKVELMQQRRAVLVWPARESSR